MEKPTTPGFWLTDQFCSHMAIQIRKQQRGGAGARALENTVTKTIRPEKYYLPFPVQLKLLVQFSIPCTQSCMFSMGGTYEVKLKMLEMN